MTHYYYRTFTLLAGLLVWSFATFARAQTSFFPTDDAYVEQGTHSSADPDVTHGTTDPDRIWVRAATTLDRKTYLKFDLTSFTGAVGEAVVVFGVDLAIGNADVHHIHVYALDDDSWTEDALTGNNAPALGNELGVIDVLPQSSTDPDSAYTFDLTEYINTVIAGDKIASIVFANPTATTGTDADQTDVRMFSSEATLLGDGPELIVTGTDTAVEDSELPGSFRVAQNYPNPFNPQTSLRYEAPSAGVLRVAVYDVLGNQVATLFQGHVAVGEGYVTWDGMDAAGKGVATGMYVARFEFNGRAKHVSMTLLR